MKFGIVDDVTGGHEGEDVPCATPTLPPIVVASVCVSFTPGGASAAPLSPGLAILP